MLSIYRFLSKLLHISLNMLFVVQIIMVILVFLTSAYWFFDLLGSDLFRFAESIANCISDFVRLFYHENIEVGGVNVDGSLLLFDILSLVFVFALSKSKFYIYNALANVDNLISNCKIENEDEFNENLENDLEKSVKVVNKVAILVKFQVKNMLVDNVWGGNVLEGVKEHEDQAFKIFYSTIRTCSGCKFAKSDDKMLILLDDFEKVDELLEFIYMSIGKIKSEMKKERWFFVSYLSIDVYDDIKKFKQDIYPKLEKLLTLNYKNEPVCMSTFKLRYDYKQDPHFNALVKGRYNIGGDAQVWTLVKKS